MNDRDPQIRQAIGEVTVPPPAPEFFDTLQERLDHESANVPDSAPVATMGMRRRGRRAALYAAPMSIAAVALAAVIVGTNLHGSPSSTTDRSNNLAQSPSTTALRPVLASDVAEEAAKTYASVQGVSGHFVLTQDEYVIADDGSTAPGYTAEGDFKLRSDGSYLIQAQRSQFADGQRPGVESYDAKTGEYNVCWQDTLQWSCSKTIGLADESADMQSRPYFGVLTSFVSSLQAIATSPDATLQEVDFNGRKAYSLGTTRKQGPYTNAQKVYVDEATLFPVHAESSELGRPYQQVDVQDLVIDPPLADSDVAFQYPKGAQINETQDGHYRRTDITELAKLAGYKPIVPSALPAGFTLAEVSYASSRPEGFGSDARDNVVITYRRGLQAITLHTRRYEAAFAAEDLTMVQGSPPSVSVSVTGGAFAGNKALFTESEGANRLYLVGSKLVMSLMADLSEQEMVALANSLHAQG